MGLYVAFMFSSARETGSISVTSHTMHNSEDYILCFRFILVQFIMFH